MRIGRAVDLALPKVETDKETLSERIVTVTCAAVTLMIGLTLGETLQPCLHSGRRTVSIKFVSNR